VNRLRSTASLVRRNYERVAERFESGVTLLERRYAARPFHSGPFEGWRFFWQPALLVSSRCPSSSPDAHSPILRSSSDCPARGSSANRRPNDVVTPSETKYILSVVLVYGGLLLLMRVWFAPGRDHEVAPRRQKLKSLWWMLCALGDAMIIAAPLFQPRRLQLRGPGRDDLRQHQPISLRSLHPGIDSYVTRSILSGVIPPRLRAVLLFLDGKIDWISQHTSSGPFVGLRLLETFAVAMIGYGVVMFGPGLDATRRGVRALGDEPAGLAHVDRGAHNDAIMAGFLVVGIALAVKKHPIWALFFCSCAAAIKAPAAIGLAFVAGRGSGRKRPSEIACDRSRSPGSSPPRRSASGRGSPDRVRVGGQLLSNGTVRSWAAPATALGLALTNTLHAVGFHGVEVGSVLSVTRLIGLLVAAGFTFWLLWHAEERGWVRSLGAPLILFVELGPVVQPWYLAWGLMLSPRATRVVSTSGSWRSRLRGRSSVCPEEERYWRPRALQSAPDRRRRRDPRWVLIIPMGRWTQWSWPAKESEFASSLPSVSESA